MDDEEIKYPEISPEDDFSDEIISEEDADEVEEDSFDDNE